MNKKISTLLAIATLLTNFSAEAKIQKQGIKTHADCIAAGTTDANCLPDDTQVYVTANGVNSSLHDAIAAGQISGSGAGIQLLTNPSFNNASSYSTGWTITTVTGSVETSTIYEGAQSAHLTYSSQTGGISQSVTPTVNTNAVNMEASCKVLTTMTTIEVCGLSGGTKTNCQTVPATGNWTYVAAAFSGPSNGTTVGVQVDTTSSGTGSVYVDDCYVGPSRIAAQVSQAQLIGTVTIHDCNANFSKSSPATTPANFSTVTGCQYSLTGALTAPATNVPGFIIPNGGPGTYRLVAYGTVNQGASVTNAAYFRFSDGTNSTTIQSVVNGATGTISVPSIEGQLTYSTPISNTTIQIQGGGSTTAATPALPVQGALGAANNLEIDVYYFPTQQQSAYRPDATPGNYSGFQAVSGGCSRTNSSYGDPSACTSIALTAIGTPTNITCSTTGSSLPGIDCVLPRSGRYDICAEPNFNSPNANVSFRMVDGSGNAINKGKSIAGTTGLNNSATICGQYNASAAGSATVKLQWASASGSVAVLNDSSGNASAINWKVIELDAPMPAPLLTGAVTSANTSATERTDRANLTCSSSSAINSQSDSWVSSIGNISSGKCSVTLATGEFSSSAFDCKVLVNGTAVTSIVNANINNKTSTSFDVYFASISTGSSTIAAATNVTFDLVCQGPH